MDLLYKICGLEIQRERLGLPKTNDSSSVENTYPEELTPEIIEEMKKIGEQLNAVEEPAKKSVNWFSSIFDWFGGLFK